MNRDDRVRLRHLADALDYAIGFVRGRARGDLDTDAMLLFALVRARELRGFGISDVHPVFHGNGSGARAGRAPVPVHMYFARPPAQ